MKTFLKVIIILVIAKKSKEAEVYNPRHENSHQLEEKTLSSLASNESGLDNEFEYISSYVIQHAQNVRNENCKKQLRQFLQSLRNSSLWAVEMFDASSKIPTGLTTGNAYHFGNYDQCINIVGPLQGKYCLANVYFSPTRRKYLKYDATKTENFLSPKHDPYQSFWEKIRVTSDPTKKRRDIFYSGVCVPSGCSSEDVEIFLNDLSKEFSAKFGYNVDVKVNEKSCSTNEPKEFGREAEILRSVIIFFMMTVLVCTIWDKVKRRDNKKPSSKFQAFVENFSITRSIKKLTAPDRSNEMDVFHGMKTLTMILVILGHRCLYSYGGPFFNPQFLEERYHQIQDMFLLNGALIVDTFFLIGGYLTFMGLHNEFQIKKEINIFQVYLYRWLRIAPLYMLIVFSYGYLLEHIGNGPIWAMKAGLEAERCRENWWSNFAFINNYVNTHNLCMFQSWYVTCDMHYILLATIIIKMILKTSRKGLIILGISIITSILIPFINTYVNRYDGVLKAYISLFEDVASSPMFTKVYIPSHNRAIPYFFGLAAAYLSVQLKSRKYEFSRTQVWLISIAAVILAHTALLGGWIFYIPGRKYDVLENALFASIHRIFWALSMGWIGVAGGRRAFGPIQVILSHPVYIPFSRLSYCTFLVHGIVQLYTTATLRAPEYLSFPKLFWMTFGDIMFSFMLAFVLYIFFEAPMGGIQKILLAPKSARNINEEKSNIRKTEGKMKTQNQESRNSIKNKSKKS